MRRIVFALLIAATVIGVSVAVAAQGDSSSGGSDRDTAVRASGGGSSTTSTSSSTTTTTTLPVPSSDAPLKLLRTVGGNISPKSVVASGRGLVFAQNKIGRAHV